MQKNTLLGSITLAVTFALATGCTNPDDAPAEPETTPDARAKSPRAGTCDQPDGTIRQVTVAAEVEALLHGRWEHCSGLRLLLADDAGIEFAADGTYYALVRDGEELVRKGGFSGQGTWRTRQEESSVGLSWHPTPSSGNGGYPVFAEGPRKFALTLRYQTEPSIYVWLGE